MCTGPSSSSSLPPPKRLYRLRLERKEHTHPGWGLKKKVIFLLSLIVTVLVSETNRLEGSGGGEIIIRPKDTVKYKNVIKEMCQEDKLTKGFSLFAPIGSCVSCAGHEETYFSQNCFSFLEKKFDSLDFYCPLSEGKNGRRFPRCTTAMCVFLSLRWMYIASAFVRSSGSRLSGNFSFFFLLVSKWGV